MVPRDFRKDGSSNSWVLDGRLITEMHLQLSANTVHNSVQRNDPVFKSVHYPTLPPATHPLKRTQNLLLGFPPPNWWVPTSFAQICTRMSAFISQSMLFISGGMMVGGRQMNGISANCGFSYKRKKGKGSFLISIPNAVKAPGKV